MIESTGRAGSITVPVEPLYRRIIEDIISKIRAGDWPVGHIVPTPAELATLYGQAFGGTVSPQTVRRSLELLQDRGILIGHQGKNVIVARIPD